MIQVIGMTASIGVGDAKEPNGAMDYIMNKCANLDAREIKVVEKYREQLSQRTNEPVEGKFLKRALNMSTLKPVC